MLSAGQFQRCSISMSTMSKTMSSMRGFFGVSKETSNVITPIGLILALPKPLRGSSSSLSRFLGGQRK
jgi:hypothetical protein